MDWIYAWHQPAEHPDIFNLSYYPCLEIAQEIKSYNRAYK